MNTINWDCYPLVADNQFARAWLQMLDNFGRPHNTLDAYARGVGDFLAFALREGFNPLETKKSHISLYVRDLRTRPNSKNRSTNSRVGLSNATMQQRLTATRLFFDYLMEEELCSINPVSRGRYTPGRRYTGANERGLIRTEHKLPWIPTEEQWRAILEVVKTESFRNKVMFALQYDGALRREELSLLQINDIDPAHKTISIRAETTKNRFARVVGYSKATEKLYIAYLRFRRALSNEPGPLFLSESRRNYAEPIKFWTWSKVVENIADQAKVPQFSTHTLRHLALTDLARSGWELHEIATYAGHRSHDTTLQYIHLSGRELAAKLEMGMASIHSMRTTIIGEMLE